MSWFADIAGKAEDLLNGLDKSAAQVLHSPNGSQTSSKRHTNTSDDHNILPEDISESYSTQSIKTISSSASLSTTTGNGHSSRGHTRTSSFESIGSRGSSKSSKNSNDKQLDDETLFEFLNNKGEDIPEETPLIMKTVTEPVKMEALPTMSSNPQDFEGQIKSLINEISNLNRRNIELETETKRLQKRLNNLVQHMATSDNTIRELQSRESDLMASLDAKDSQIGVLKIRLQETDDELRRYLTKVDDLEQLNESLRMDSQSNSSTANESLDGYRQIIRQLETDLQMERDELKRIQTETMEQIGRLEDNQKSLVDEMSILQRNLNLEKSSNSELELKAKNSLKSLQDLEQDYNEFKLKANKTLADKDELIRALKSSDPNSDSDEVKRLLQSQCDAMALEIQELRDNSDYLKRCLDRVQNEEVFQLNAQISSLMDELKSERKLKNDLELELRQLKDDSNGFRDGFLQTKVSLESRINDRDIEIEKLRKQLVSKLSNSKNIDELENRVKGLTDNLIQKQTAVEQLNSEKHNLSLQLERSEQRLREVMNSQKSAEVSIGIHHSPSFSNLINRQTVRPMVEEYPEDGNVTRRVKRAYGQIDAFSIRLGNFLRAYPSARAALLAYIFILHIWVAFVLIYYEPEQHGPNFKMPDMSND